MMFASELPMQDYKQLMKPRRERSVTSGADYCVTPVEGQVDPNSYSKEGKSALMGLVSNEFIVKDWETYFQMSSKQFEEKISTSKTNWCDRNFQTWMAMNNRIEPVNILKEVKIQQEGPHQRPCLTPAILNQISDKISQRKVHDQLCSTDLI